MDNEYILEFMRLIQYANNDGYWIDFTNSRINVTYDEITLDGSYLVPLHEYQLIEICNN